VNSIIIDGQVYVRRVPLILRLVVIGYVALCASVITAWIYEYRGRHEPTYASISQDERFSHVVERRTVASVMTVRFVSPEELQRRGQMVELPNAQVGGMADLHRNRPCEIFLPTGMGITLYPRTGQARWLSAEHARVVAHEIAHCMFGSWHPQWPTIVRLEQMDQHQARLEALSKRNTR
jgi:hypothetical protein